MQENNLELPFDIKKHLRDKIDAEKISHTNKNLINFFYASIRQDQVVRLYVALDVFKTDSEIYSLLRQKNETNKILKNEHVVKISQKYNFKFIESIEKATGASCIKYCNKIMTRINRIFEKMDRMKIKHHKNQNNNVKDLLFFYGELRMVEDILHFIILFKDYTEEVYLIPYYKFHKDLSASGFFHMFSYRKLDYDDFFERFFTFNERYLSFAFDMDNFLNLDK